VDNLCPFVLTILSLTTLTFLIFLHLSVNFSFIQATTKVSNEPKKVKGAEVDKQQIASGLIVLLIFLAVLMSVVTCGAAWVFRETLLHWIK